MASFSLEDFVGNGALKELMPTLMEEGWDDVPTLKMMNTEDMDAYSLSQQQRDALEIRTYLHDRSLMEYADKLEASGKGLPELLNLSPATLSRQYNMKRGHVARFLDRTLACGIAMPPSLTPVPTRRRSSHGSSTLSRVSLDLDSVKFSPVQSLSGVTTSFNPVSEPRREKIPVHTGSFKGIVAAAPAEPRFCGLIRSPPISQDVASLSVLDKVSLQKIAPEYRPGVDLWSQGELKLPPPMKASGIWASKPSIVFCIRRPGCIMCRAEAHQLFSRKPIFDALGVQLVAVLNECIDAEVRSFWPRFWGGMIFVDKNRDFFKALGGGRLLQESFFTGFLLNPVARANHKRAKAMGLESNLNGEGTIKGGLFILRPGNGGVVYQFVETNFGDWAPLEEVFEICGNLHQQYRPNTVEEESADSFQST